MIVWSGDHSITFLYARNYIIRHPVVPTPGRRQAAGPDADCLFGRFNSVFGGFFPVRPLREFAAQFAEISMGWPRRPRCLKGQKSGSSRYFPVERETIARRGRAGVTRPAGGRPSRSGEIVQHPGSAAAARRAVRRQSRGRSDVRHSRVHRPWTEACGVLGVTNRCGLAIIQPSQS